MTHILCHRKLVLLLRSCYISILHHHLPLWQLSVCSLSPMSLFLFCYICFFFVCLFVLWIHIHEIILLFVFPFFVTPITLSLGQSMLSQKARFLPFMKTVSIPFIYVPYLLTHSSIDGASCFHMRLLWITLQWTSGCIDLFKLIFCFLHINTQGWNMAGSSGSSVFHFWGISAVSIIGCTNSHSHQQYTGFPPFSLHSMELFSRRIPMKMIPAVLRSVGLFITN